MRESERKEIIRPVRIAAWTALVLSILPIIAVLGNWAVQGHWIAGAGGIGVTTGWMFPFGIVFPSELEAPAIVALAMMLAGLFIFGLLMGVASTIEEMIRIRAYGLLLSGRVATGEEKRGDLPPATDRLG